MSEKLSKVEICKKCDCYVLASHMNYITEHTEKEFTELTNEGFEVKLELVERTQLRKYSPYENCKNDICKPKNTNKNATDL